MQLRIIKDTLDAAVIYGEDGLDVYVDDVYASDLMSDVLAFGKPNSVLLTGLASQQAVISAHMAEFKGVVFIRGKQPDEASRLFARVNHMILLSTKYDMFDACVRIESAKRKKYQNVLVPSTASKIEDVLLEQEFSVNGRDFQNAGSVSTEIKSILKKIGFNPKLVRRVAIATYEAEMNVVMHAEKARVGLRVSPYMIGIIINDQGKGIPDINLAMQEGYTTATDEMRAMGFGSGMGLPNIKRNTDDLHIESEVGRGTKLELKFKI